MNETGLVIPERCIKCELSLETIEGCIDCLRIKSGLPKDDNKQINDLIKRIDKLESKITVFEDYTIEKIVEQKKRLNALERFTIDNIAERNVTLQKKKQKNDVDENIERGVIG